MRSSSSPPPPKPLLLLVRRFAPAAIVVATPAGIAAARGLADLAGVVVIEAAGGATDALGLRCLLGRSDADYDSAAIRGATLDKLLVWALGAFLQGPALFVDADAVVEQQVTVQMIRTNRKQ